MELPAGQPTTPASPSPVPAQPSPAPAAPAAVSPAPATPPAAQAPAPAAAPPPAAEAPKPAATGAGDRPAYVPEKFWDPAAGLKADDFSKHLQALETFHAEQSIRLRGVPEKPEGYQMKLPEGFKPPEGVEIALDGVLTGKLAQFAHQHGLTQEAVEGLLVLDAERMAFQQQQAQEFQQGEIKKLGAQGGERLDAVIRAYRARGLPENVLAKFISVADAADIEASEKWLRGNLTPFNASGRDAPQSGPTPEQLEAMPPHERLALIRAAGRK